MSRCRHHKIKISFDWRHVRQMHVSRFVGIVQICLAWIIHAPLPRSERFLSENFGCKFAAI
jgi:hypothetical protein